ncbi:hypothetical protein D3C81_1256830 [compost metagenome]
MLSVPCTRDTRHRHPKAAGGFSWGLGQGTHMDYVIGLMGIVAVIYAVVRWILADFRSRKGGAK